MLRRDSHQHFWKYNPEKAKLAGQLKEQLFKELKAQGDPCMFGKGEVFDRYPYAAPEHRDSYRR